MFELCYSCASFLSDDCAGFCDFFPKCFEDFHSMNLHNMNGLYLDEFDIKELF